jgi:hypothetical protein
VELGYGDETNEDEGREGRGILDIFTVRAHMLGQLNGGNWTDCGTQVAKV